MLVRLLSRNSDVIGRLLPTESYDIGIAELPIDETAVRFTRFRMRCVAILPPGHKLGARATAVADACCRAIRSWPWRARCRRRCGS